MDKVVLITRIKIDSHKKEGFQKKELKRFKKWLKDLNCKDINKIFIVSDEDTIGKLRRLPEKIKFIKPEEDPICPTSMNTVIEEELPKCKPKPKAFVIASQEVKIKQKHIKNLINYLGNYLCLGYKFQIKKNRKMDRVLKSYYTNKKQIAYYVPWNTCIIWNYKLFKKHIKQFDKKCNGYKSVTVTIDGNKKKTNCKGMEDGLAIAKAIFNNKKIEYALFENKLWWTIRDEKDLKIKLERKTKVLRKFIKLNKFSVKDLLRAKNTITLKSAN